MYISSPGGYRYPRPLSWDVSASELAAALEWTFDIGEVSVSYSEDINNTRSYSVSFDVSIVDNCIRTYRYASCRYKGQK